MTGERGQVTEKVLRGKVGTRRSVQRRLLIEWDEVDRLLDKAEYAAALLVAAVNVEFILWERLRQLAPAAGLAGASDKAKFTWGQIRAGHGEMVTLSSLISVAECFTQTDRLSLSPSWDPLARDIDGVRNRIATSVGTSRCLPSSRTQTGPRQRSDKS